MKIILFMLLLLSNISIAKPILISFDGSGDRRIWKETLDFAKENSIHFTYFISAPYFITKDQLTTHPYWAESEIGKSFIKFSDDEKAVKARFGYLNRAISEGHELGSHLCGHYDGSRWTKEQWLKEFEFFRFVFKDYNIVSIRTPGLGVNRNFFSVFKRFFSIDSSIVGKDVTDTEIPIRMIKFRNGRHYVPFDYELDKARVYEQDFFDALCDDYLSSDYPTQICLHFMSFPGQPYMKAMKRFIEWAKDKNPQYMTYHEFFILSQSIKKV